MIFIHLFCITCYVYFHWAFYALCFWQFLYSYLPPCFIPVSDRMWRSHSTTVFLYIACISLQTGLEQFWWFPLDSRKKLSYNLPLTFSLINAYTCDVQAGVHSNFLPVFAILQNAQCPNVSSLYAPHTPTSAYPGDSKLRVSHTVHVSPCSSHHVVLSVFSADLCLWLRKLLVRRRVVFVCEHIERTHLITTTHWTHPLMTPYSTSGSTERPMWRVVCIVPTFSPRFWRCFWIWSKTWMVWSKQGSWEVHQWYSLYGFILFIQ